MAEDASFRAADALTVTPSRGPNMVSGIGFGAMGAVLAYLAAWAVHAARNQRDSQAGLCAQLGAWASEYDFCQPGRGSDLEGLALLPTTLAVLCLGIGAYLLYQAMTTKEVYTFHGGAGELRRNGVVIGSLREIAEVSVNRYGKALAVDLRFTDGGKRRLSTYLSDSEANQEAERIAAYIGVPARKHSGLFG
jgi:hypothetical protein